MPDSNIVEVENVWFGYDPERPVLRDVSVTIPRGKVVAIMGQSGCGKTTLLRIIGGVHMPTKGRAHVLGELTSALGQDGLYAMRRRMGMKWAGRHLGCRSIRATIEKRLARLYQYQMHRTAGLQN